MATALRVVAMWRVGGIGVGQDSPTRPPREALDAMGPAVGAGFWNAVGPRGTPRGRIREFFLGATPENPGERN